MWQLIVGSLVLVGIIGYAIYDRVAGADEDDEESAGVNVNNIMVNVVGVIISIALIVDGLGTLGIISMP